MATIHYLTDAQGKQQVFDLIANIAITAREDKGYAELTKYIAQGLSYLEEVGVPNEKFLPFVTEREDGRALTFATILKELRYHPPLLEFRINWQGAGAFRAIFFYISDEDGEQHIYFTKAILKQESNPPELEQIASESEIMLKDFCR